MIKFIKNGVDIVLNGGKDIMDSATIPVKWHFDQAVINQDPQYVLLIEQNANEIDELLTNSLGRRYVCKITEAIKFIQLFRAGHHRLAILIFSGSIKKHMAIDFTDKESSAYKTWVSWSEIELGSLNPYQFIAAKIVEFDVPEELFASKPQTKWQTMIWRWVNAWYKQNPVDQCEYRKRKVHAFTWKPSAWLISAIIYAAFMTCRSILEGSYVLIASILVFLAGWRPHPIFENTWKAMRFRSWTKWNVVVYKKNGYRLWNRESNKYIPITGVEILWLIALFAATTNLGLRAISLEIDWSWPAVIGTIFIVAMIYNTIGVYARRSLPYLVKAFPFLESRKARKEKPKSEAAEKRRLARLEANIERQRLEEEAIARNREFMMTNFSLDRTPTIVDLKTLPAPRNVEEYIQRFYVSFSALKARICKPYAK